jgi:hypothetical protein
VGLWFVIDKFIKLVSLELDPTGLGMKFIGSIFINFVVGQAKGPFLKVFRMWTGCWCCPAAGKPE